MSKVPKRNSAYSPLYKEEKPDALFSFWRF